MIVIIGTLLGIVYLLLSWWLSHNDKLRKKQQEVDNAIAKNDLEKLSSLLSNERDRLTNKLYKKGNDNT